MFTFVTTLLTIACALFSQTTEGMHAIFFGWSTFVFGLMVILFVVTKNGKELYEVVDDNLQI